MHNVISHHFSGGIYAKHVTIPEGQQVVTHAHGFDHMSILASGAAIVTVGGKSESHIAPAVIEIKAGANHSIEAVSGYGEVTWFCIHATDYTDESDIDEVLVKPIERMKFIRNIDVERLRFQVGWAPSALWNEYTMRTSMFETSPHREVSDIWLRYRDWSEFDADNPLAFADEHVSVNYPANLYMPMAMVIAYNIIDVHYPGAELGGVLITKIPPGGKVYPHSDAGAWHSEYYDKKILVLLESAPGQTFNFANESHEGVPGDVFEFDNRYEHWVNNDSDKDRISLIFAIRSE